LLATPVSARQATPRDDDTQRFGDDQQNYRDQTDSRSDDAPRQAQGRGRIEYREERIIYDDRDDNQPGFQSKSDESFFEDDTDRLMRVHGDIVDLRTIKLVGLREPHLFAKIDADSGGITRADLGPSADLADIREGDDITVFGTNVFVNDRP